MFPLSGLYTFGFFDSDLGFPNVSGMTPIGGELSSDIEPDFDEESWGILALALDFDFDFDLDLVLVLVLVFSSDPLLLPLLGNSVAVFVARRADNIPGLVLEDSLDVDFASCGAFGLSFALRRLSDNDGNGG